MDNYETGIYTDNPDDTLRYMQTTQPVDLWGYPKCDPDMVAVVRCKDCRWWDKKDGDNYGYCHAAKHGYFSKHWEISIYRTYKLDFYCADGERRSE